jgi:hypothetical protein
MRFSGRRNIIVYVAGPYRAPTVAGIAANISAAEDAARKLWQLGFTALCPHLNTAYFDGLVPDDEFLRGDLALLEKCDAIFLLKNWEYSQGAIVEAGEAERAGIPALHDFASLEKWADEK